MTRARFKRPERVDSDGLFGQLLDLASKRYPGQMSAPTLDIDKMTERELDEMIARLDSEITAAGGYIDPADPLTLEIRRLKEEITALQKPAPCQVSPAPEIPEAPADRPACDEVPPEEPEPEPEPRQEEEKIAGEPQETPRYPQGTTEHFSDAELAHARRLMRKTDYDPLTDW